MRQTNRVSPLGMPIVPELVARTKTTPSQLGHGRDENPAEAPLVGPYKKGDPCPAARPVSGLVLPGRPDH